jgi:hypothetical protein
MGLTDLMQKLEMPLVEVLAELEWNGITVDGQELERQRGRLQTRIDELAKEIQKAAMETIGRGFNPDSPKQLAGVLFNKPDDEEPGLGLKVVKRTKTGASTDIEVLEKLAADPEITTTIPSLIVEYRQFTKLVSTYLVALKEAINRDGARAREFPPDGRRDGAACVERSEPAEHPDPHRHRARHPQGVHRAGGATAADGGLLADRAAAARASVAGSGADRGVPRAARTSTRRSRPRSMVCRSELT